VTVVVAEALGASPLTVTRPLPLRLTLPAVAEPAQV
jgi:hypothetical protein